MAIATISIAIIVCVLSPNGRCENFEKGLPFIQSFTPDQYGALGQNTDIIQDEDGVIYIANQKGILEYDGVSWRLHEHPDGIQPLSLAITEDGDIYAGFNMDICRFKEDNRGNRKFVSLLNSLPDSLRKVSDVWTTIATHDGIFFMDWLNLFQWMPAKNISEQGKMHHWTFAEGSALMSYNYVHNRHIISRRGIGLLKLENGEFLFIPNSEIFSDFDVYEIIALSGKNWLILTKDKSSVEHWFVFDGITARTFDTPIRDFARENFCLNCINYNENLFALSTETGGVALFDTTGKIMSIIDKLAGLSDNLSHRSMLDDQNGAWILTDFGLSRVTINPNITYLGDRQGLDGTIMSIKRFEGVLYVGTDQGLFRLDRVFITRSSGTLH